MRNTDKSLIPISLNLPAIWKNELHQLAIKRGTTTQQIIRDAIWMWMGHEGVRPDKERNQS